MDYFVEIHQEPKWLEHALAKFGVDKKRVSQQYVTEDFRMSDLMLKRIEDNNIQSMYVVVSDGERATVKFETYPIWGLTELRFQDSTRNGRETVLWTDNLGQIYSGHFVCAGPYNTFSGSPEKVHPKYYRLAVDHVGHILNDPFVRNRIGADEILRPVEVTSSSI